MDLIDSPHEIRVTDLISRDHVSQVFILGRNDPDLLGSSLEKFPDSLEFAGIHNPVRSFVSHQEILIGS